MSLRPPDPRDPPDSEDATDPTEQDKDLEKELEETFPSSDPPSTGGPGM